VVLRPGDARDVAAAIRTAVAAGLPLAVEAAATTAPG
jgi:hypothetical protein